MIRHEKGNIKNAIKDALIPSIQSGDRNPDGSMSNPVDQLVQTFTAGEYIGGVRVSSEMRAVSQSNALHEFVERNPKFLTILNEFYKHGEEGKKALDALVNKSGQLKQTTIVAAEKPVKQLGD